MCMLSMEEEEADLQYQLNVSKTNIFARHSRPGYQYLVYNMSISSPSNAAMILPLPVAQGSGEDALRFLNLNDYKEFFDDISLVCTPEYYVETEVTFESCGGDDDLDMMDTLVVHSVGDFEASYVPSLKDFDRVDERFRLPDEIWQQLSQYHDYGFAVFQLKLTLSTDDGESENAVQAMAFEFPTRDAKRLFFPTVHVHDGEYHDTAGFYHTFYCQFDNARCAFKYQRDMFYGQKPTAANDYDEDAYEQSRPSIDPLTGIPMLMPNAGLVAGYEWFLRTKEVAKNLVPVEKAMGIIDPEQNIFGMTLIGHFPNTDMWLGDSV
ncbi:MAG: hypothetical protein HRU15_16030 [Planctomycetes bacterium]|nr:hypothetical protein [Planctomycetota bacterium]